MLNLNCQMNKVLCDVTVPKYVQNNDPPPLVSKDYSYAYGRSRKGLVYQTIGDLLDEQVANETDRPMIISHHEKIEKTFTQFSEDVNRLANAMVEGLGLKRGDVVGIWSGNTYNWITVLYATAKLGIILCTINPYYKAAELNYVLRKADVKTLFMPGKASPQVQINNYEKHLVEALQIGNDKSSEDQFLLENIVSIDGEVFNSVEIPSEHLKFHTLEKLKQNQTLNLDPSITGLVTADDPALIMFTSGTTGKPKGALLSQFGIVNNALLGNKIDKTDQKVSFCVPLPFFHAFPAIIGCIAMTATPFQLVIPYLKHRAAQIVESINANHVTHLIGTPTLILDLINYLNQHKDIQIPSLSSCLASGASVPVETAHKFVETVPSCTDFSVGYGATELGVASIGSRPNYSFEQRSETIGTPLDFVEIKLVNPETKRIVKIGETGEIHSRGFNTMLGYWKDPIKTSEVIDSAGWYNTGDLGVMSKDGFFKVIGRTKDMIIVGGENVYPKEIEELLHTHPAILEAHVIGLPDARKGEEICVWIKLKEDKQVEEQDLKLFCKEKLAYFKVPRYYLFVDSFPKTSIGKAKKLEMRQITCEQLGLTENK